LVHASAMHCALALSSPSCPAFSFLLLRRPPPSTLFPYTTLFRSVFFCVSKNVSVSCAYTQGKREQFSGFNRTLDAINNVFRKFIAFHDETGRLNVDGMNIISNDGSNKLNRSRKARVSYKVQRTINASLNAATSTRAVSSNPNFVTDRSRAQIGRRFSRNAETELVCRLLLEQKNEKATHTTLIHTKGQEQ